MSILKFGVDIYDVNKRPFKSDNSVTLEEIVFPSMYSSDI